MFRSGLFAFCLVLSSVVQPLLAQDVETVSYSPKVRPAVEVAEPGAAPASLREFSISLYPNPAHSIVYLRLPEMGGENWTLSLLDSSGNTVDLRELTLLPRSFSYSLPEEIAPGKYLLKLASPTAVSYSRLTVCAF